MNAYDLLKQPVYIPEGESGNWSIKHFKISVDAARFENLRSSMHGGGRRDIMPGDFVGLFRGKQVIMSNTPAEVQDHVEIVNKAHGQVLIAGLGLGLVTMACLTKDDVDRVVVVEKSPDVIRLIEPTLRLSHKERLVIIEDDIFSFKPSSNFDVAWFDIWDYLCTDNLQEYEKLKRRFRRHCEWMGFWVEDYLRYMKRRGM